MELVSDAPAGAGPAVTESGDRHLAARRGEEEGLVGGGGGAVRLEEFVGPPGSRRVGVRGCGAPRYTGRAKFCLRGTFLGGREQSSRSGARAQGRGTLLLSVRLWLGARGAGCPMDGSESVYWIVVIP